MNAEHQQLIQAQSRFADYGNRTSSYRVESFRRLLREPNRISEDGDDTLVPVDIVTMRRVGTTVDTRQDFVVERLKGRPARHIKLPNTNKMRTQSAIDPHPLWAIVEPAYEAWLRDEALPVNGTPLAVWDGISPDLIDLLKRFHVRTLEEFADMTETEVAKTRYPNVRSIQKSARAFLDKRKGAAEMEEMFAGELAEKDAAIADLTAKMEQMAEMIAAMKEGEADKPKRGAKAA